MLLTNNPGTERCILVSTTIEGLIPVADPGFPRGAKRREALTYLFGILLAENCMTMKKFELECIACDPSPHIDTKELSF